MCCAVTAAVDSVAAAPAAALLPVAVVGAADGCTGIWSSGRGAPP